MGCAQWNGLQPCLPENKFSATMTTTHTALRADKTEQKVELRSSKNASLSKKPSGLIARTELIMCCKTINNNFRNLSLLYLYPTNVHLRFVLLGAIRMVFVERSVFCAKHS